MNVTEERIMSIEKSNKRMRFLLFLTITSLIVTTIMGFSSVTPQNELKNLKAKSLDIINDEGVVVLHLGVRSSGSGGFWLTDEQGNRMIKINQNANGGRISIMNKSGEEIKVLDLE